MGRPIPSMLEVALDPARARAAVAPLVHRRFGAAAAPRGLTVEAIRRGVVRYGIVGAAGEEAWRLVGKVYESPEAALRGHELARGLWEAGFCAAEPAAARIPEPYACLAELHLCLMEEAPGRTLKDLIKDGLAAAAPMVLFAEALAKLHRALPAGAPTMGIEGHLEWRCHGLAGELGRTWPELAAPIRRIVRAARESEEPGRFGLAHGDYHPGQVNLERDRIWILDLDPLHLGDPAYDVAMVLVTLRHLERGRDAERFRILRRAFLSSYFARMDPAMAARVPLQAALIHLKRACKRFRYRDEAAWEGAVRAEVGRSAQLQDRAGTVRGPEAPERLAELWEGCSRNT